MLTIDGIAVLAGAVSGGVALYAFANSDFASLSESGFPSMIAFAAALWLVAFAAMITIAVVQVEKTKRGYRYPFFWLIGILVVLSFAVATVLFGAGYGPSIDDRIAKVVPMYKGISHHRHAFWASPHEGRLYGVIIALRNEDTIIVKDQNEKEWEVTLPHQMPVEVMRVMIEKYSPEVAIIGSPTGKFTFTACAIRPWRLYGDRPMWRSKEHIKDFERNLFGKRISKCRRMHISHEKRDMRPPYK